MNTNLLIQLSAYIALIVANTQGVALGQQDGHDHAPDQSTHASQPQHPVSGQDPHGGGKAQDPHTDSSGTSLQISADVLAEFGIEIQTAVVGALDTNLQLSGEVVFNADRVAHVTPSVSGITRSVSRSVGEHVEAGDVMAVLSSRDLAATRSAYLAALARKELASEMLTRDQRLLDDRIGTERQVLESQQVVREAEIALNLAEQSLHALGENHETIRALLNAEDTSFTEYRMRSPIAGVVIERHLTRGERISDQADEPPFVIADLSSVWVNLTIYQRDLARVKPGQPVWIAFGHGIPEAVGSIAFVSPAFDNQTRTTTARVVLDNTGGNWHPGLFITAYVSTDQSAKSVIVPRSAITQVEGGTVVFVQNERGFEPRGVRVGGSTESHAEIVDGLERGERFVARNVLALKAELNRAELEHAGHAH